MFRDMIKGYVLCTFKHNKIKYISNSNKYFPLRKPCYCRYSVFIFVLGNRTEALPTHTFLAPTISIPINNQAITFLLPCFRYLNLNIMFLNTLRAKFYLSGLKTQSVPRSKRSSSVIETAKLMLYREIIAVFFLRSTQKT